MPVWRIIVWRRKKRSSPASPIRDGPSPDAPKLDFSASQTIDVSAPSLIVRDIENSLKLYRDVFGLKVNYDNLTTVSGPAFAKGIPGREIRLILLNGNDPWIGWIGLINDFLV